MLVIKVLKVLKQRNLLGQLLNKPFCEVDIPLNYLTDIEKTVCEAPDTLTDDELLSMGKLLIEAYLSKPMIFRVAKNMVLQNPDLQTIKDVVLELAKEV